jgi:hypothetical protein
MCDGKSRRDDISVEKQPEINKNPEGMACKIIIFTCHPDGFPTVMTVIFYQHAIPMGFLTDMDGICLLPICHPSGILLIFKFRMCDGKSRRDEISVEKQPEINKNPGGMACKIIIFNVSSRWDSRPSWLGLFATDMASRWDFIVYFARYVFLHCPPGIGSL